MEEIRQQKYMTDAAITLELLEKEIPSLYAEIISSDGFPLNFQTYRFWIEKVRREFPQHQPLFDFVLLHNTQDPLTFYVGLKLNFENPDQLLLGIKLSSYQALQIAFLNPDFIARKLENMTPFKAALTCATKMHKLCAPIGDIFLSRVYARQANFVKGSEPGKAKGYCIQALEALRGFHFFHQPLITSALRDYDKSLNVDIDLLRNTLLHAGYLTSEEIAKVNADWGIVSDTSHTSSQQTRVVV